LSWKKETQEKGRRGTGKGSGRNTHIASDVEWKRDYRFLQNTVPDRGFLRMENVNMVRRLEERGSRRGEKRETNRVEKKNNETEEEDTNPSY